MSDALHRSALETLRARAAAELSADFRLDQLHDIADASEVLDVMGGIAEETGALTVKQTLYSGAAVLTQRRADAQIQLFSFNEFDAHRPFTLRMPLAALARCDREQLRSELAQPGRGWAGPMLGAVWSLHQSGAIDLLSLPDGLSIASYSSIPAERETGATLPTAVIKALLQRAKGPAPLDPFVIAAHCGNVQTLLGDEPSLLGDRVAACVAASDVLLRILPARQEVQPPLSLPAGFRIVPIDSRSVDIDRPMRLHDHRIAAAMAHAIILQKMRQIGQAAGRELIRDPMAGHLGNLDQEDYKRFFRSSLPEQITGHAFVSQFGPLADPQFRLEAGREYHVLGAADHHILEARRVRQFCQFIEQANALPADDVTRHTLMDKAGHLMYASHLSTTNDARLGNQAADAIVQAVRAKEKSGLYGARMTGLGAGGVVAVLCVAGESPERAIREIATTIGPLKG